MMIVKFILIGFEISNLKHCQWTIPSFQFMLALLLEPIKPIAKHLQGQLQEAYLLWFKILMRSKSIMSSFGKYINAEHNQIYCKVLDLSTCVGSNESIPVSQVALKLDQILQPVHHLIF